jgi:hypothetical protein
MANQVAGIRQVLAIPSAKLDAPSLLLLLGVKATKQFLQYSVFS